MICYGHSPILNNSGGGDDDISASSISLSLFDCLVILFPELDFSLLDSLIILLSLCSRFSASTAPAIFSEMEGSPCFYLGPFYQLSVLGHRVRAESI